MQSSILIALLPALVGAIPLDIINGHRFYEALVALAPPEANVTLKSVNSSGTGCASNSASFVFKDDASVVFDSMIAQTTPTERSKRCLITMDLQLDPKWKYTINKESNLRGYAEGASGTYKVIYTAGKATSEVSHTIDSPSTGGHEWVSRSTATGVTSGYGGGVASIDVSLSLNPNSGSNPGAITIDSIDTKFEYTK